MPDGAAYRFDDTRLPTGGNLTDSRLNSLDVGLNVYTSPDGGLYIRVSPGTYAKALSGTLARVDHAGQASNLAVTASITNRVFVSSAGVITVAAAFPTTAHLPLAEVTANTTTITSIVDKRPRMVAFLGGALGDPGDVFVAGNYYSAGQRIGTAVATFVADTIYAVRFDVATTLVVDRIAAEVTTLHAANNIRLAIFAEGATADSPAGGALVVDGGVVSTATTGVKTVTIAATTLVPGRYWLAVIASSTTIALRCVAASAYAPHGISATDFSASGGIRWKGTDGANDEAASFPSTFPASPTLQNTAAPVLALRAA